MRTVHKYVLTDPVHEVVTHAGVRFLHVGNQYEQIAVWAEVDTRHRTQVQTFYVVGTGHSIPAEADRYLGSALVDGGNFVFHVYTRGDES